MFRANKPLPPGAITVLRKSFDSRRRWRFVAGDPIREHRQEKDRRMRLGKVRRAAEAEAKAKAKAMGKDIFRPESPAVFNYAVLVDAAAVKASGGRMLRKNSVVHDLTAPELAELMAERGARITDLLPPAGQHARRRIAVVGAGPAGLFAALTLASAGCEVVVLERGEPVERRGRDIGALFVRRRLSTESNLCYGEGGAGTWSDGKLTTRIGSSRAAAPRVVMNELVSMGAPPSILVAGKPHIGTDRLVRVLRAFRARLETLGCTIRFGARVEALERHASGAVAGVTLAGGEVVPADAVVLAPGHSARDTYAALHAARVEMACKPFAIGVRIEQPQASIDEAQYGAETAASVQRGRGPVPVAEYRMTAKDLVASVRQKPKDRRRAWGDEIDAITWLNVRSWIKGDDGAKYVAPRALPPARPQERVPTGALTCDRGAWSFCMCPGGQVVPTATQPGELCVNGMSFSRRDGRWANSAVVTTVGPEDWAPYVKRHGPLAGVALQRIIERRAALLAGGDGLSAPAQRVEAFIAGAPNPQAALPPTSYRLGVVPAPLHDVMPPALTLALRTALQRFGTKMPAFLRDAVLIGVETRTSAPVTILRGDDCQSPNTPGLYPCGEGAGYAGGIMSAAVDGIRVALSVLGADADAVCGDRWTEGSDAFGKDW